MKRVAIVGSRDYTDFEHFEKEMLSRIKPEDIGTIVSGGAKGADSLARQFAHKYDIDLEEHLPKWKLYGAGAGYIRNKIIVLGDKDQEIPPADIVFAFWDGVSKGTKHSISLTPKDKINIIYYKEATWSSQNLF